MKDLSLGRRLTGNPPLGEFSLEMSMWITRQCLHLQSVTLISPACRHLCTELFISCNKVVYVLFLKGRMPKESSVTSAVFSA